jgi:hypothetical protein
MRAHEIAAQLEGFTRRGPGTDAERRAANWLAGELTAAGAEVRIDPFWCRPNWAFAHAWHVALVIAGSLVSVSHPRPGLILLLVALASIVSDALFGVSLGRRLTPERASQNVTARPRGPVPAKPFRLVITANYDAGRTGLVYRDGLRRSAAWLRRATGGFAPGWLGWVSLASVWLIVVAVLRIEHHRSTGVAITQFVPTVLLVIAVAALIELATAEYGPAANDNGSGAAVAAALARALVATPPGQMDVELVLAGAGEGGGIGLRRHLRRRAAQSHTSRRAGAGRRAIGERLRRPRPQLDRTNAAVLAFAASGAGDLHFWTGDGSLVPLRYSKRFRQLCAEVASEVAARPHAGRGTTPGYSARLRNIPAITLGCLDGTGITPRSHRRDDTAAELDVPALDKTVEFGLILVDALDSFLARRPAGAGRASAPAAPDAPGETVTHGADT